MPTKIPLCYGICNFCGPSAAPVAAGGAVAAATAPMGDTTDCPATAPAPGPCAAVAAFLREWFWIFMIGSIVLMVAGVALLAVGINNIASGKNSTTGQEFLDRNKIYADNAKSEIASATGIVTIGSNTTSFPVAGVSTNSAYKLSGVSKTWSDAYATASIPRATFPASGDFGFTLTIAYTCSACAGTAATVAPATAFTSTSIAISNATGWALNRACVVVTRTHKNSAWILDADQASCFYPFDADSNKYSQSPSANVELVIRSKFDYGYFWLEEQSMGSLDMPDKEILLVDPNTPIFLGAGAALLVIGIIFLCVMCCCFRRVVEQVVPV